MSAIQAMKKDVGRFVGCFTNATKHQLITEVLHIAIICAAFLMIPSQIVVVLLTLYCNVVWSVLPDSEDKMLAAASTSAGYLALGFMSANAFVFIPALFVASLYASSTLDMLQKLEQKKAS